MRKHITLFRIAASLVAALFVTYVILIKISSGYYLFVPDIAHPVAPLVRVQGAKPPHGSGTLYFVDVHEIQASEFDMLFRSWLYPHSTKVLIKKILPPGTNNAQYVQTSLREMVTSQKIAGAVAERELGYKVVARNNGVLVDNVYRGIPATAKVEPADVIVAVNGQPTMTIAALRAVMDTVKPGDIVKLTIVRGAKTIHEDVKTLADPQDKTKKRAVIGILPEPSVTIHLPVKVSIDSHGIGGPSAGLAFTLEVMRKLGADVTHGYRIAATGQISLDGSVLPIGGVKQKTFGVREAGAQVFLVPKAGGNARDARKFAGPNLRIIPVTSLKQALRALAALPKLP